MKKILYFIVFTFLSTTLFSQIKVISTGQVGIGISAPNNKLDVQSASLTTPCGIGIGRTSEEGTLGVASVSAQYADFAIAGDITLRGLTSNLNLVGKNGISFGIGAIGSMKKAMTILTNGNVGVGTSSPQYPFDVNGNMRTSWDSNNQAILYLGDPNHYIKSTFGYGVTIGTGGSDVIYMPQYTGHVGISMNPSYSLDVNGATRSSQGFTTSDKRLKSNIKNIALQTDSLLLLRGVSYSLINHDQLKKQNYSNTTNIDISQYASNDSDLYNRTHIGFIAQEVQKIFPYLVSTDKNGILSVDYTSMIPLLVEALKKQQSQIDSLKQLISKKGSGGLKSATLSTVVNPTDSQPATLDQNYPNPFNQSTQIGYYIPETTGTANLYIYNMNGLQIKTIPIQTKGKGSVTINGSELQPGMYIYTLVADGKEIDTKRMILTE